jgi:hypothetical protein
MERNTSRTIEPKGMNEISHHHPDLPVSCNRRIPAASKFRNKAGIAIKVTPTKRPLGGLLGKAGKMRLQPTTTSK